MTSEEFHDTNCLPDLVLDGGVEASFLPGRLKSPILFNSRSKAVDTGFSTGVETSLVGRIGFSGMAGAAFSTGGYPQVLGYNYSHVPASLEC